MSLGNYKDRRILGYIVPIAILIITISFSLRNAIWLDEVFSLKLSAKGYGDILRIDAMDVHPPLYYFILRTGLLVGNMFKLNNIVSGKLVSVFAEILLFFIAVTKISKRYGRTVSVVFCLLLVSMPQMIEYFTEIRMYAWGALFVTCTYIFGMDIVHDDSNKKAYLWMTVFSILSVYTHYYACVGSFLVYLELITILLLRKKSSSLKKVILSGIVVVFSFLPWIIVLLGQVNKVNDNYWIAPISLTSIRGNIHFLIAENEFKLAKLAIIMVIIVGIMGIFLLIKNNKENPLAVEAICSVMILVGTFFIGISISLAFRPIFVSRYMFCAIPCFWLGIAMGIVEFTRTFSKKIVVCGVLLVLMFSALHTTYAFYNREKERCEGVESVLNKINEISDENTIIASNSAMMSIQLAYYFPQKQFLNVGELPGLYNELFEEKNLCDIDFNDVKDCKNVIICDCDDGLNPELSPKLAEIGRNIEKDGDYNFYMWHFNMSYME